MITIKSDREIELLSIAGNIVYETHQFLKQYISPGITTLELDKLAYDFILSKGATPSFKGYDGFPGSICASVNEQVVHGIPSTETILKDGDNSFIYDVSQSNSLIVLDGELKKVSSIDNIAPDERVYSVSLEERVLPLSLRPNNTLTNLSVAYTSPETVT